MSSAHSLLLLGLAPGGQVLEVSGDGGGRARALRAVGYAPTCLRPTATDAEALRAQGFDAVSLEQAASRPGFDAALVAAATGRTRGEEWLTRDLAALAARIALMLRPGASFVLSLPNPLHALPGIAGILERQAQPPGPARGRGRFRLGPVGGRALGRALEASGLVDVRVFAALPGGGRPKFLVPLGDGAVLRYFLGHMVPRPRSAAMRAAVGFARAIPASLLDWLLPAYEVSARRAGNP